MRFYLKIIIFLLPFVIPTISFAAENLDERFRVVIPAITFLVICCFVIYFFIKIIRWLKIISNKLDQDRKD